ncbi:LexA family transcriptional regulator [Burkholderia vietnamiensis]|uniref:LexA family transcriptional regulator n=1 Tax=Burkholderia vietnamiensis TaxID=60552 RepID=A0ABS1ATL6_BURVI|nr:LexA family transcriptional regulator [Burkholderia vietnamiensis]MBJ9687490.1 LexA family transcriptional regulator [Burkholderia vietnamiensis]
MRTLADRLKSCRDDLGISQTELAKRAGVSQSTVANIESGRNQGSKHLVQIAEALDVRVEWLNSGKAPKSRSDQVEASPEDRYKIPADKGNVTVWTSERDLDEGNRVWIDRYDYHFSAGDGLIQWEVREKQALPFNESFFKAIGARPKDCKLVTVRGDSMEPFLYDRDVFMIDESKRALRDGKIYAVYFEDEPLVKQIFKKPGGRMVLHSFNAAYPDIEVGPAEMASVHIVGECVYRSGSGFTSH